MVILWICRFVQRGGHGNAVVVVLVVEGKGAGCWIMVRDELDGFGFD
jgi:hypothetical protein